MLPIQKVFLREGIQDYEKIRILLKELAENQSREAAAAARKLLNDFMNTINTKTFDKRSAADIVNEGKKLLADIARSVDV
jgi:hypothetical protein